MTVFIAPETPRKDLELSQVRAQSGFGEEYEMMGRVFPARHEDYIFCTDFCSMTEGLLAAGRLQTHPTDIRVGGLEGIAEGLQALREKSVHAKKIVYRV